MKSPRLLNATVIKAIWRIAYIVLTALFAVLLLSFCTSGQPNETTVNPSPSEIATLSESTAGLTEVVVTPTELMTTVVVTPIPTQTEMPTLVPATLVPTQEPLTGWQWHKLGGDHPYTIMLPKSWQQVSANANSQGEIIFQSPETKAQIVIEERSRSNDKTWQQQILERQTILGESLSPLDEVISNSMVAGRPAFLHLTQILGGYQANVIVPDETRLLHFSLLFTVRNAEKQIFQTVVESLTIGDERMDGQDTTFLLENWETSHRSTIFPSQHETDDVAIEITGIVAEITNGMNDVENVTLVDDNNVEYVVILPERRVFYGVDALDRGFGTAGRSLFEVDNQLWVIGRPTPDGAIVADTIGLEQGGQVQVGLYSRYFELANGVPTQWMDGLTEGEPLSFVLRGSMEMLEAYLVNTGSESISAEITSIPPDTDTLATGMLISTAPLQLEVEQLTILNGHCYVDEKSREHCRYWQQAWPPIERQATTITATIATVDLTTETEIFVLETPVDGFVTITLAPDVKLETVNGDLQNSDSLIEGMQIVATGVGNETASLVASEVIISNR